MLLPLSSVGHKNMPTHNKIAHPHLSRQHAQKPCRKLKIGNPAAHEKIRLMLLGSPPDMVHGISLRKTDLSTPLTRYGWHITPDRVWGFIPALADCRYRAPLTPRLVRPCYKPAAHTRTIFCFRESLNKSARAGSEGFCSQARDGKWRNTVCISHFSSCGMGAKDPLSSRRRIIQRFLSSA